MITKEIDGRKASIQGIINYGNRETLNQINKPTTNSGPGIAKP